MNTLIALNKYADRWYPNSIDNYMMSIKIPMDTEDNKRLKRNFAYSMQYIEYIEKQLAELKLSSVLVTMLYKSYIITGMSIVELLFVYILKSTENWNKTEWIEEATFKANPIVSGDNSYKTETKVYKKVLAHDMRMDLDSMIKRIEKKHILTIDHSVFPVLKQLRELRNRVHLQAGDGAYDHDYNNFGFNEIQMMRRILHAVLTAPELCVDAEIFDFIINKYNENNKD